MNAPLMRGLGLTCVLLCSLAPVCGQHRVDPRNMYERVLIIAPKVGSGSKADPVRAMYAPTPAQMDPVSRSGILGFQCVDSDDGKFALCEFVAKDRKAFAPLLADPGIKAFLKNRDKLEDILTEFKKHKKDFDLNQFGVRVP